MQEKKFINFPCNSGLSGQVFTTGDLKVCNDAEKETAFVDEIDNQPKVRNVKNFMIGPVYGEDKKIPVGVIQFINKKNEQLIDEADRQRFNDLADLIGMCIENTNAIHTTIGVTLMFNTRMEKIQNYMNEHRKHNSEQPTLDILGEIGKHMKECQGHFERLTAQRRGAQAHLFQTLAEPTPIAAYLKEAEEQRKREAKQEQQAVSSPRGGRRAGKKTESVGKKTEQIEPAK